MNQLQRDKRAVRTVLEQTGGTYFDDIALRGGEGLWPALKEMLDNGEVTVKEEDVPKVGRRRIFRLASSPVVTRNDVAEHMTKAGVDPEFAGKVADFVTAPTASLSMEPVAMPTKESLRKVDEIIDRTAP